MTSTPQANWNSHPPYKDACAVGEDYDKLSVEYPLEAYPWMTGPVAQATDECMYTCHSCGAEHPIDKIKSERINGDWWYVCRESCTVDPHSRVWPDMMRAPEYDAIVQKLVAAHPEDLVNIISRVIHDRTDMTGSADREFSYGEIIVPGCPGEQNCAIDEMGQEHPEYPDRLFTVEITGDPVSGCPTAPDSERQFDANGDRIV